MTGPPEEPDAMTDPIDDTQPRPGTDTGADIDQPARSDLGADSSQATDHRPAAGTDGAPGAGAAATHGADPGHSLRADPDRPADSGWREPPWFPPRDRDPERDRRPSPIAIVIGLVLIAIGLYYFLDRTLGVALPAIQWSSVWPIILIVLGGLILVRSFQRKS
jgi:hypothetical protein